MNQAAVRSSDSATAALLDVSERASFGVRLGLSMASVGCLAVAVIIRVARPGQQTVSEVAVGLAAALVVVPTLIVAWRSLRQVTLHGIIDQLIAIAVLSAWAAGDLLTAALLPLVMTLGHILEERSLLGSQEAIRALSRFTRTPARRLLADGTIEEVSADALKVGDRIELRAGDRVPADGVVETGDSSLDMASITGESVPVDVRPGSDVHNASMNLDGRLIVRITRVGGDTTLGRVIALLSQAEKAKPPVTRLLERYAQRYLILVLLIAAGTWFTTGSTAIMLAVLVASCPCALVLAAPATSIAAISVASRHGILVKGAAFLEMLASVDSVAFDKTGTLTHGHLRLVGELVEDGVDRRELLELAAKLGAASSHPVSRAVASERSAASSDLTQVQEVRGLGVTAETGGQVVAMGRAALFDRLGVHASDPPAHDGPIAGVSRGKQFLGWLLLADEPRAEAAEASSELRNLGLTEQILITGDREITARRIAATVGIPVVYADLLPAQKMERIFELTAQGYRPMVVGDGINDALALKAGAVGIALGGTGSDIALSSADMVLMATDLRRLATSVRLSRRCRRLIYANVTLGLVWTAAVLALAVTGALGPNGAVIAAIAQNFSSLLVIVNAGRLLKFDETGQ